MHVHCDKESQLCTSQLKCHSKCLCFDQVLHICLKKKKKNAANNALCSPPVVGKRKKEDGGFRKQLTLSRPINFSVQKDKWLVFSTK